MTDYLILEQNSENAGVWEQRATAVASSPASALRSSNLGAGTYVAVPSRSFKPLKVKVENTVKVTIC